MLIDLEVTVQVELVLLGIRIQVKMGHDTGTLIFADSFLEKVGLSLQRDQFHEIERVLDIPLLWTAQLDEETIRNKLNVLAHELVVHADQTNGQGVSQKFLFNFYCV